MGITSRLQAETCGHYHAGVRKRSHLYRSAISTVADSEGPSDLRPCRGASRYVAVPGAVATKNMRMLMASPAPRLPPQNAPFAYSTRSTLRKIAYCGCRGPFTAVPTHTGAMSA